MGRKDFAIVMAGVIILVSGIQPGFAMRRDVLVSALVLIAFAQNLVLSRDVRADPPPFEDRIQALLSSTDSPEQAAKKFVNAPGSPGTRAIGRLFELSQSDDYFVQERALAALHELKAERELEAWQRDVGSKEEQSDPATVLFSPYAGSNEKISAIRELIQLAPKATSLQGRRAIAALVRQTHYDMPPVREFSRQALVEIFGGKRADEFIAAYLHQGSALDLRENGQGWKEFADDFSAATKGWNSTTDFAEALAGYDGQARRNAMKILAQRAAENPDHLKSLNESLKLRLLEHLERFDRIEPAARRHTLVLVERLGLGNQFAASILIRALADPTPEVHKIIERLQSRDDKSPEHQSIESAISKGVVDSDSKIATAAAKWVPAALSPSFKAAIARAVADAAENGNEECLSILKRYEIKPAMFARAVAGALGQTSDHQRTLALLRAIRLAGAEDQLDEIEELRAFVVALLDGKDESLATASAEILVAPKARGEGESRILASIEAGETIRPTVLKAFNLEPEEFSGRLVPALQNKNIVICGAGMRALLVTGIKGDKVRPALESLARNLDSEIRHGAAELLNTPEALAEAKVPDLLEDIRSNSLSARQLAARQLDELNIEPKEITAALVRAVESGDFAARQGLLAALNDGYASRRDPLDVLRDTAANEDAKSAVRAFARAGLREVEHPTARKVARP
jgi:hypothetical protein